MVVGHRVSPVALQSYIERKSQITYPEIAKLQHVEGEVILKIVIDRSGKLRDVQAVSGPLALRQGAINGVKDWRFKPYYVNGQPVEVESEITMNFHLNQ